MAQKIITMLEDDITGEAADETVTFGLDGKTYEIDLTSKNALKLRNALASFTTSARVVGRGPARIGRSNPARAARTVSKANGYDPKGVRAWALANGHQVPARGRIPGDVLVAYEEARPKAS